MVISINEVLELLSMKLRVIILNYRTPWLAVEAVRSLRGVQFDGIELDVVVVDNDSRDGSMQVFSEQLHVSDFDFRLQVIDAGANRGFASGNNCGIVLPRLSAECADPKIGEGLQDYDAFWLLNPDAYLMPSQDVPNMLRWMLADAKRGIVGTAVVNDDGRVRVSAFRFPGIASEVESALGIGFISRLLSRYVVALTPSSRACRVDWVSGASFLISRSVIESIGLMDDGYFMYFEETDYCLAAQRAGFETWYWPDVKVVHLVGQASGVTGSQRRYKRRPTYWFDSRRRYFTKNLGPAAYHLSSILWIMLYPVGRLWSLLRFRRIDDPPKLWLDFYRHYLGVVK